MKTGTSEGAVSTATSKPDLPEGADLHVRIAEKIAELCSEVSRDSKVVVIHSSLLSFFPEQVDPHRLLDLLFDRLGPDHTLVVPTFTHSVFSSRRYHFRETRSEMGILTNCFLQRPGVVRSPNPLCSFAAIGPLATEIMRDENDDDCWGDRTPFASLFTHDALVLSIGVGLDPSASILHYAESRKQVPYRYYKTVEGIADYGAGETPFRKRFYVRRLDVPVEYNWAPVVEELKRVGGFKRVDIGNGFVEIAQARDLVDTYSQLLDRDVLTVLTSREAYLEETGKRLVSFLSSANVDYLGGYFQELHLRLTGKSCRILKTPFGQAFQQLLAEGTDLRVQNPNYLIFLDSAEAILGDLVTAPHRVVHWNEEAWRLQISTRVERFLETVRLARKCLDGHLLVVGLFLTELPILGLADCGQPRGSMAARNAANDLIQSCVANLAGASYIDPDVFQMDAVVADGRDAKYRFMGRLLFGKAMSVALCNRLLGAMLSIEYRTARLLVVDLDNTLWSGIVGEGGGIQLGTDYPGNVFRAFQTYLRDLSSRGLLLAICSKNTPEIAIQVIEQHPEMVLRMKDFRAQRINWEPKHHNLLSIAQELSLSLANICFIDDNPAERSLIRQALPDVIVPEMPEDPAEWIGYLKRYPFLEMTTLTVTDLNKQAQYRIREQVEKDRAAAASLEDYYRSLNMRITIAPPNSYSLKRVHELITKTNQFNTTTRRHSLQKLEQMISQGASVLAISLEDRYSEKEIIGVVILTSCKDDRGRSAEIETFVLSCRVLGRRLESAVLAQIVDILKAAGFHQLVGRITATDRNQPVRGVYRDHGFRQENEGVFVFDLDSQTLECPGWFVVEALLTAPADKR